MKRRIRKAGAAAPAGRCAAVAALAAAGAAWLPAAAQAPTPAAPAASAPATATTPTGSETVTVTGRRMTEELPPDKPHTVIGTETIERRQAENIFDILKGVPGLGVEGGPRATGMKFSLRGFTDNEDVVFKIDGAVKGFEKYRFGSGVLLEPELVKTLTVERGPAVTSGSGALGGTISAATKSAMDLLRPGRTYGGMLKLGYNDNNGERLRMLSVYGRPGDFDIMAAVVRRDSHDLKLADRSRLTQSQTQSESRLVKLGWFPHERLNLELGYIAYASGPERQPYDATGGLPGVGGSVIRTLDDETTTLRAEWDSPYGWTVRGLLSREQTYLHDLHRYRNEEGLPEARICAVVPSVQYCDDRWRFDIVNAEVFADTKFRVGPVAADLTLGWQGQDSRRDTSRVTSNEAINQSRFPGGHNPDQPPGDKVSSALIGEARLQWHDFTLVPGVRLDRYTVSARGLSRLNMESQGQDPDIEFSKTQPSLALSWRPGQGDWTFTARYNEGFRPPLIDEYFAEGGESAERPTGRCRRTYGDFNQAGSPVIPSTIQPLYDPAGLGLPYDPARDLAPANGICGDLYRPQESASQELTVAWNARLPEARLHWSARLTAYRIHTRHLLGSLRWVDGRAAQPGREDRRGVEFEGEVSSRSLFASLSYGRVRREGTDDSTSGMPSIESFQVPADSTVLTLGTRLFGDSVNAGWRVRHLADRRAYASGAPAQCVSDVAADFSATQKGVTLNEIFAFWQINRMFSLRASVDNLDNRDYCLVSSFSGAVGFRAPGRAAKIALTAQF